MDNAAAGTPTRVGPYRVVRPVAEGGMAVVYEVRDAESGRAYAAKVLRAATGSFARFAREYRALTRFDHPNVVRVYRYGLSEEGAPYLVMELLEGQAAQARVKHTGRPGDPARTAEAVRIAMFVARALAYVHGRGVVHRDLKSSNVIVLPGGQVKVLDFGTARLTEGAEALTEPGEFVGTFHYASPEQLTGGEITAASDLYALGVLLYRMLCGRRPFEGDAPQALARAHLHTDAIAPNVVNPGIPDGVSDLTMRLLAKKPEDRPADASEVATALDALGVAMTDPSAEAVPTRSRTAAARASQLRAARQAIDAGTRGLALLFTGAEGSGRARVVDAAVEDARMRGSRTFSMRIAAERRPLVALASVVASTFPAGELDDGWTSEEPVPVDPPTGDDANGDVAELAALLAARADADDGPVVVAVRDLWRGSPAAVSGLFAVFERLHRAESRVVLLAAWDEGPVPRVWDGARRIALPPLNAADVALLASQELGASAVTPEIVRRVLHASGGRAALVETLLRAVPRRGPVPSHLTVPEPVADAIQLRLDLLAPEARRLVETVALAEGDLGAADVAWAVDAPQETVAATLKALAREGVLTESEGCWSFTIGIGGDIARARTRPTRRNLLCRRIADRLGDRPPSARIAEVLIEAGRPEAAARAAVAWAEPLQAARRHADALPVLERLVTTRGLGASEADIWRLYAACMVEMRPNAVDAERAVRRAAALATTNTGRADAALCAARLARTRSDVAGERRRLTEALEHLVAAGDQARTAVAEERLAEAFWQMGELEEARARAEAAANGRAAMPMEASIPADVSGIFLRPSPGRAAPAKGGTGSGTLARVLLDQGDLRRAETVASAALRGADPIGGLRAATVLSAVLRAQGRLTEARSRVEPALGRARVEAPPQLYAGLLVACARLDLDLWRIGQARERLSQALDVLRDHPASAFDGPLALQRARLARLSDEREAAAEILREAYALAMRRGYGLVAAHLDGALAVLDYPNEHAVRRFRAAHATLGRIGALPALAEIAALACEDRLVEDPASGGIEAMWEPARGWLDAQPARLARLDWLLAIRRAALARGDDFGADDAQRKARALYAQLRALLSFEDDAAMAVHPVREALGGVG